MLCKTEASADNGIRPVIPVPVNEPLLFTEFQTRPGVQQPGNTSKLRSVFARLMARK